MYVLVGFSRYKHRQHKTSCMFDLKLPHLQNAYLSDELGVRTGCTDLLFQTK